MPEIAIMFRVTALALILVAAVFASGCEKKGPAEKAGEKIDRAYTEALEKAEEAGEKMEEAGEKIDEAVRKAEEALEEAGKDD
jgi:hyperosmotically inducible protein